MDRGRQVRAVLFLMFVCCMIISSPAIVPKNTTTPLLADSKQEVLALGQQWVAAENKHDVATLRRILDDKFIASFGTRKPYDKEAFIKLIVSDDVDPTESQTLTDELASPPACPVSTRLAASRPAVEDECTVMKCRVMK